MSNCKVVSMKHFQLIRKTAVLAALASAGVLAIAMDVSLLEVCYEPTPERYEENNAASASYWMAGAGDVLTFDAAYDGSGGVTDGLQAVPEQFHTEK